jgi:hypothetical protein
LEPIEAQQRRAIPMTPLVFDARPQIKNKNAEDKTRVRKIFFVYITINRPIRCLQLSSIQK